MGGFDATASVKTTELLDLHTLKPLHVAEPDFGEEVIENETKTKEERPVSPQPEETTTKQGEETGQAKEGEDDDDDDEKFDGSPDQKPVYEEEEEELFEEEKPFTGPLIAEDVARTRFLPGPSMLECRANFGLALMPEDEGNKTPARHMVLGGLDERGRRLQTTEWLDVMRLDEEEEEEEEQQQEAAQQTVAADDMGFGFAGDEEEEPQPEDETESEEEEEPEKEFGFETGPRLLTGRSGLGAVRLSNLILLCAGGVGEDGKPTESTEYYNNETGDFKPGPPLSWIGKEREEGKTGGFGFCAATRVT